MFEPRNFGVRTRVSYLSAGRHLCSFTISCMCVRLRLARYCCLVRALRKNDFHIKKAVEDLVDRKVEMAAQSARSKMLMQASQMALATSQVNPLGLSSKSFYVMQEGGTGGTDCEESPRYGPGLNPALYVSKIPGAKIASSGRKKALLIGINYFGSNKELNGCCDDVARVKHLLCSVYGFLDDPASLTMLTDKPGSDLRLFPTRHNIVTVRLHVCNMRVYSIRFQMYARCYAGNEMVDTRSSRRRYTFFPLQWSWQSAKRSVGEKTLRERLHLRG